MRTLIGYEMKKILQKKSTIVAFLILFAIQVLLGFAGNLGSTYVNDEFYETHARRNRTDRELGLSLSGRTLDEELIAEMKDSWVKIANESWDGKEYMWSEVYKNEFRRYEDLQNRLKSWGFGSGYSYDDMTEENLYALFDETREELMEAYELSEEEIAYWDGKAEALTTPLTYQYALAFEQLVDMQGGYMTCMLMTFFIAITMVSVFADEHTGKTDQLLLCSRHGKNRLYAAKLIAGSAVVFGVNLLFSLTLALGHFCCYGVEGFDASLQFALAPWYPYDITMGQTFLILLGILLLSSVMVAIFTMLLAEVIRSSIGAMAVVIGLLFAARLIPIPATLRLLSQGWNFLPINLLKVDQGFLDLRLVNLFGLRLTSWQLAPLLYVVLIVGMVLVGARVYRNYQVSGR